MDDDTMEHPVTNRPATEHPVTRRPVGDEVATGRASDGHDPATSVTTSVTGSTAAATFTVGRHDLLGGHPLLGSAEIARRVCRAADRTVSVLSITDERMRRIDGWLDAVGVVTHAAGPDPSAPLLGSVCDRTLAGELIGPIVESLVGPFPMRRQPEPVVLDRVAALAPTTLPPALDWVVVASGTGTTGPTVHTVIAAAAGLVMGDVTTLDAPVTLRPVDVADVHARLVELVGTPPRSVRDLLGDA